MGRHRVPNTAGLQFGKAHLQLAGSLFEHIFHDQLVDYAVVALFHLTGGERVGLQRTLHPVDGHQLCRIGFVRSSRVDVEFCRFRSILALESHFLVPAAHIKSVAETQRVLLAVHGHDTVAADIDHAQLTRKKEVRRFERIDRLEHQLLRHGYRTAENKTVVHRIGNVDLVGNHHLFHQETAAQPFRVVRFHILRIAGRLDFVIHLGRSRQCSHTRDQY